MQFSVWQSRKWYDRGQKSYELGNFSQYRKEMERSSGWVPKDAHLLNVWGWQTMRRIDIIGEMETAALAQEAAGYWERSLDVQPDQVFCHYNLGWLYLQSDAEIAARHFRQAAEINPTKRGVYFGLALASKKLGKTEPALRALALECLSRPEFSLLPMWEDSNFLSVRKEVSDLLESFYARIEAEGEVESSKKCTLPTGEILEPLVVATSRGGRYHWRFPRGPSQMVLLDRFPHHAKLNYSQRSSRNLAVPPG